MLLTSPIETARLQLRLLTSADALLLQRYLLENRDHLACWEPLRTEDFYSLTQCHFRLEVSSRNQASGNALPLAIFNADTQELAGFCNFSNIVRGHFQAGHLGYAIAEKFEGKGYMHEALQAAIQHLFEHEKLHRIMANYIPGNLRSAALLARLKFQTEGYASAYLCINGQWCDHVLTALTNPHYQDVTDTAISYSMR
jgi:ribosomal-protein-alanine N-acetyltransferase